MDNRNLTYQGFKQIAERLGYDVDLHYSFSSVAILVQDLGAPMGGNIEIATVSKNDPYCFTVYNFEDTLLDENDWKAIIVLCRQLAATPLESRKDDKHKSFKDKIKRFRKWLKWN